MLSIEERDKLVLENQDQVFKVARSLTKRIGYNTCIELGDLVSVGMIAMLGIAERYEPARHTKFKTYAELRLQGAMIDYLRSLDWIPRSARTLIKKIDKMFEALGEEATETQVAEKLNLTVEQVRDAVVDRIAADVFIIGRHYHLNSNDELPVKIDPPCPTMSPYDLFRRHEWKLAIWNAVALLPVKERCVVMLYYEDDKTMKQIGQIMGFNESRTSQLHAKAIARLRKSLLYLYKEDEAA